MKNGRRDWLFLAASGLAALGPLIVFRAEFARLFWFGDEFDQIDIIDRTGLWHWAWMLFGENFMPVFKFLDGLLLFGFHGSYFALIVTMWLAHALTTVALGRVMRAVDLPWIAVWFAQAVFALTPITMETLGWAVQFCVVLCLLFMLLALDRCLRGATGEQPFGAKSPASVLAYSAASACSFARGVVTGPILAAVCLWPPLGKGTERRLRAWVVLAAVLPAVVVAGLIKAYSPGNHQHMHGHWGQAGVYALWYYCLNPAYRLFGVKSWGWPTMALLGALKLALVGWVLVASRGWQRRLMFLLVIFDLANAFLLGIGRYHTGLPTSVSSRYQYDSMIGILPLAGYGLAVLIGRLPFGPRLRALAAAAVLGGVIYGTVRSWPEVVMPFTEARGTETRRVLLQEPHPATYAVPGIPFMTTARARELIKKYHLH